MTPAPGRRRAGAPPAAVLMRAAEQARRQAHAPYSKFRVGAALLATDGRVFHGCNVENASYGLSVCAERTALWSAIAAGARQFSAIAISAGADHAAPPCGACRQVLGEFAPELWVVWRGAGGRVERCRLDDLLPEPFVFPRRGR